MTILRRSVILGLCLIFISTLFAQEDKPQLKIGGALRFNYNLSSWKDKQVERGGDFGFDTFFINAEAKYKGLKLIADYRFYTEAYGGHFLKKGWVEYDFNPKHNLQLGLTQVPFGIGEYNSHSYFFSMNYYIGLEDDYDMGIKYGYKGKKWELDFAFFKNSEEMLFANKSDISLSRYGYDIASLDGQRNKEVNQLNARLIYKFEPNGVKHRFGLSAMYGGIYDLDKEAYSSRQAYAAHVQVDLGHFNAKLQATYYNYKALTNLPKYEEQIAMGAYNFPYFIAQDGFTYTAGLAYTIPIKSKIISSVQLYNDFSILKKGNKEFSDSYMNILGAAITAGNIFMYVDCAMGKNHPYLGASGNNPLGAGDPNARWNTRFNINLGYYF